MGVPVISFALIGTARGLGTGRFLAGNVLDQIGAAEAIELVGKDYEAELKKLWASKHGRTGETEQSISGELIPGITTAGEATLYDITIAGNVGFVLNPLPPHVIEPSYHGVGAIAVGNPMTGPFQGRTTNSYSSFGPVARVNWFQGGSESFGPDPKWYEDAQPYAEEVGLVALNKVGAQVAALWGADGHVTTRWAGNL